MKLWKKKHLLIWNYQIIKSDFICELKDQIASQTTHGIHKEEEQKRKAVSSKYWISIKLKFEDIFFWK